MNNSKKVSILFALLVLINISCDNNENVQPDFSIPNEKSRPPIEGCPPGQFWNNALGECGPNPYLAVDNQLASMGATQVAIDVKSRYIAIGNQSDIYIGLTNLKNLNYLTTTGHNHATSMLDDILNSSNQNEVRTKLSNFKLSLSSTSMSSVEKARLETFATIVEGILDDIENDPNNAGLTANSRLQKFFCGVAIASYAGAAVSLVLVSGGTAAVLVAGIGYSLATASLATCFL